MNKCICNTALAKTHHCGADEHNYPPIPIEQDFIQEIHPARVGMVDPSEGWNPLECARFNSVKWECHSGEDIYKAEGVAWHEGEKAGRARAVKHLRENMHKYRPIADGGEQCLHDAYDWEECSMCAIFQAANDIEDLG